MHLSCYYIIDAVLAFEENGERERSYYKYITKALSLSVSTLNNITDEDVIIIFCN